jgi:hypothetical protein
MTVHQVGCWLPHHLLDVLVNAGHFVGPGRQDVDALLFQVVFHRLPVVRVLGLLARHAPAGPVRCGVELSACPLPRTTKAGSAIEPGITPSTPSPAGVAPLRWTTTSRPPCTSFQAKLWWFSTPAMTSLPSKLGHQPMNHLVIGGGVVAHQVHGGPVLLARLAVERQPGQAPDPRTSSAVGARAMAL